GRPSKRVGRSASSKLSVPRFVQMAEAVREGGARQRQKRRGAAKVSVRSNSEIRSDEDQAVSVLSGESISLVPESHDGLNLEVILQGNGASPRSGIDLLLNDDNDNHVDG
ncbi:hypothetical protein A2U01_0066222, partial [Trifolium medium]|nr:hypothetical protein [Trifolium medium]